MRLAFVVIVIAGCGASSPPSSIETGASPGPLVAGHQAITCIGCHVADSARVDSVKCLACHTTMSDRIAAGIGLHASTLVRTKACETCHVDHRGTSYDARGWQRMSGGSAGFDHDLAGWRLTGAHRKTACDACHTATDAQGPTFVGAARDCATCHATQPHGVALACERCHTTATWSQPKQDLDFDHETTRMPLRGAHRGVACTACHANALFTSTNAEPARCDDCHRSPHANRPYAKLACAACHTDSSFDAVHFDHDDTRFPLGSVHRTLACATCHIHDVGARPPSSACETCHPASPHKDRFNAFGTPPKCELCHAAVDSWRPRGFRHSLESGFPRSVWKHFELDCRQCHRGTDPSQFERLQNGCTTCHAHKLVHVDPEHPNGRYQERHCRPCHTAPD